MPLYEVPWQVFGLVVVEAEDEDAALFEATNYLEDEISIEWDGLDLHDAEPAASWQTAVN